MTASIRIKPLLVCALLVSTLAAGLAAQKYGVKVTVEKNVNFSTFKTYAWTTSRPSPDKTVDGQIIAAVDRELAALGMSKAAAGQPDVFVTYYSVTRTDVDVKAKPNAAGARPERTVGSLLVALLNPASRKPVLQLRIDKPIDVSPATAEAVVNGAVSELFTKYPARTAKP